MQNNKITIGDKQYARFKEMPDKTTYVGPNHSLSRANLLMLSRNIATVPDQNAKSKASFVIDVAKPGSTTGETGRVYANIEFSYPQWATESDMQGIISTVASFLPTNEFNTLIKQQSI